jgi:PilZ domain-containing protein
VAEQDRRRTPRYSFVASAEVVADTSDLRVGASISELSLHGCYLDMPNPFPLSTPITLKISAADEVFQSKGRIIYLHPGIGAGVTFLHVAPQSQAILRRWLDAAEQETLHSAN